MHIYDKGIKLEREGSIGIVGIVNTPESYISLDSNQLRLVKNQLEWVKSRFEALNQTIKLQGRANPQNSSHFELVVEGTEPNGTAAAQLRIRTLRIQDGCWQFTWTHQRIVTRDTFSGDFWLDHKDVEPLIRSLELLVA